MNSIFGIGAAELIVILILAGLLMGPERIRDVARVLGRVTAQLQAISRQFARQLNAELDGIDDPATRATLAEMKGLRDEFDELKREVRSASRLLSGDAGEALKATREAADAALQSARPPRPTLPALGDNGRSRDDSPSTPRLPTLLEIPDDPD